MYGGRNYNHSHHQHHHYPNHHREGAPTVTGAALSPESALAADIFEQFISASTFKSVLHHYRHMCDVLRLRPQNIRHFYPKLKNKIRSWKAQAIWSKFDKRASHKCYNHGKACSNTKVLIIGSGPCGLRTAIEAQLLGAKVVVVEKRDRFSRHNVLHLWPFVITDLKALGAKKFYGKFCAGAIDHISIRQLQCILLKVALLLGVEVFEGVTFEELLEPPEDQSQKIGWHARFSPMEHPVNQYEFDVLIGADGKRNTLMGFRRKEFRGKLAIAITANFINKHSEQEARVQEISGVAFIFNQKFFKDLHADTGIDLENIVYYKDETHYFVMTAKKHSLIDKGVILRDLPDTQQLLHPNNVDREALCSYAREAADFSTNYQMPHLDFAVNHYGKPDIAMFDFTSMFAAENACRVVEAHGHKLLQCLVGDSLLEPFWPTGSGCARGFLSSFDAAWAIRSWSSNRMTPLEVIAERESIYRLLAQTTPENLSKDYSSYTLEPSSRYPTINLKVLLPFQVRHLYITDEADVGEENAIEGLPDRASLSMEDLSRKRKRRDSLIQPDTLLSWCQKQVVNNENMTIEDLSSSFKDGRALCTILHRYRPDLLDMEVLDPSNPAQNCQLAFDILEREFGIPQIMTGSQLADASIEDTPDLIAYISQIHDALRGEIPHSMGAKPPLKVLKGQSLEGLDLDDFPHQPRGELEKPYFENNISNSSSISSQRNGRISCRILDEPKPESVVKQELQKPKKRRNESGAMDANTCQRREEIARNREERIRKQKEQRELDTVRFVRSMRMLRCDVRDETSRPSLSSSASYLQTEDPGIAEYRKNAKSMREKALELERKLYFPQDKTDEEGTDKPPVAKQRGLSDQSEDFSDRVKGLEAKFKGEYDSSSQKPKDLIRAVGKLEKTDWNLSAIERKIEENPKPMPSVGERERVPKWSRDNYNDKFQNIERRLRENGEDEERIAKYLDIDASLKRLERKLREGSTLETGLRGHNKVSNLANQLSSKLVRKEEDKTTSAPKQTRTVTLPTSSSDLCYFCGTRVYLVERLSAEGKFFHRQCLKCSYCGALLRLGNYIYDRENRYGGKFFCIPHFGLTVRSRVSKRPEEIIQEKNLEMVEQKDNALGRAGGSPLIPSEGGVSTPNEPLRKDEPKRGSHIFSPASKGTSPLDRRTTPERVEFENSVIEASDEDEYLSEDEWTDRNFGASANELDDEDDDDSDYSDLSDEEVDEEALLETSQKMTVDETRRLAESWKRRYSNDVLEMSDDDQESFSESENDEMSEHGAEGDESHTPTEGEVGEDDDEDDEGDHVRRARELRRLEVNINVGAPPRKTETSDSGSETEVGSDEESETQIETDSEFADDHEAAKIPKAIPTIVIDEMPKDEGKESSVGQSDEVSTKTSNSKTLEESKTLEDVSSQYGNVDEKYVAQVVETNPQSDGAVVNQREGTERSASLSNIPSQPNGPNPRTEQLKRLLQRTESTEAVSAQRNYLRRQYLLGNASNVPRKSVSTADIGNKFKSFMDKISETQKKLNPAPQPSPAMQAFLNLSNKPDSPVPLESNSGSNILNSSKLVDDLLQNDKNLEEVHDSKSDESSDSSSKSEEGKLITFSPPKDIDVSSHVTKLKEDNILYCEKEIDLSNTSLEDGQKVELRPLSPSHEDKKRIDVPTESSAEAEGEKGSIDSEQPEKEDSEKLFENPTEDELGVDGSENEELIEAFNMSSYGEQEPSEHIEEALNIELISNENIKNISEHSPDPQESFVFLNLRAPLACKVPDDMTTQFFPSKPQAESLSCKKPQEPSVIDCNTSSDHEVPKDQVLSDVDENIDEVFDRLASDAMTEFADSESHHSFLTKELDVDARENKSSDFDKSSNIKLDTNPNVSDKKQNESGFRSLEDSKTHSYDLNGLEIPLKDDHDLSPSVEPDHNEPSALLSPETEAVTTEADLSDWVDDNEAFALNAEDFETEFNGSLNGVANLSLLQRLAKHEGAPPARPIARIASLESLGDSDSAISISASKPVELAVVPMVELEKLEYMDNSESESSHEDAPSVSIRYNPLGEGTPTTPLTPHQEFKPLPLPQEPVREIPNLSIKSKSLDTEEVLKEPVLCRSSSQPHRLEEGSPLQESSFIDSSIQESSVQESSVLESSLQESSIQESVLQESSTADSSLRDSSQLESPQHDYGARESLLQDSSNDSSSRSSPSRRYEGYIPRFKDRVTPFSLARDSIDVHKNSTSKPLFTPSKEDIIEREKGELQRLRASTTSPQEPSPTSNGKEGNSIGGGKAKDGDLVRAMVMSRMPKKNAEKGRRGSRNALHLSHHSSSSSLFGSEPSLEVSSSKEGTPKDIVPSEKRRVVESGASDISSSNLSSSFRKERSISVDNSPPHRKPSPPVEKKTSPRSILPATPLTHPEKFKREETVKRELFKSSPQLNPSPLSRPTSPPSHTSFSSSIYSTPPEFPYLPSQNVSLSKSLINTSSDTPIEPQLRRLSESEGNRGTSADSPLREKSIRDSYRKKEESERPKKDPDERLKQLLEERRRRENEEHREVRMRNKNSCLQECLEEYRQKRSSAPVFTHSASPSPSASPAKEVRGNGETPPSRALLGLVPKRHAHRPSLLELETMQIFSSSPTRSVNDSNPAPIDGALPPQVPGSTIVNSSPSAVISHSGNSPSFPPSSASAPVPPQSGKGNTPEKKSTKKSKDRERRRSLIQVVAGMFSKSDEKKKEKEETEAESKVQNIEASSSPVILSPAAAPKSPSVKERFSKLRLSRSKEKKKSPTDSKNRSSSVDIQSSYSSGPKANSNSLSLPTSPSRTIFSFLSSSPARPHEKSRNSTSGSSTSYLGHRFSPSCIKEENNSEDEVTTGGGTPQSKDSPSTISTPSLRRQKAALRAAKQAEQKRLRMAQEIQRQLEECEVKTRELEERGINVEKALIGETEGLVRDEADLMKEWFSLVHEKNALVRWQEELTVKARELELEDRHLRLENELRQRMTSAEREKTRGDIEREGKILAEIISIIEQKDALVNLLEEDRQRYAEEDRDLELVHARKVQHLPYERETGV